MDKNKIGMEDLRIREMLKTDDNLKYDPGTDLRIGYVEGFNDAKKLIVEYINNYFIKTYSSEDSATTAIWNLKESIKKQI